MALFCHGVSDWFDVPNKKRDITKEQIEQIYEATGCKVFWRARPGRGKWKKS